MSMLGFVFQFTQLCFRHKTLNEWLINSNWPGQLILGGQQGAPPGPHQGRHMFYSLHISWYWDCLFFLGRRVSKASMFSSKRDIQQLGLLMSLFCLPSCTSGNAFTSSHSISKAIKPFTPMFSSLLDSQNAVRAKGRPFLFFFTNITLSTQTFTSRVWRSIYCPRRNRAAAEGALIGKLTETIDFH